jgi:hypothetical protein
VKSQTSLRLLVLAAATAPILAFWPEAEQEPANVDWAKHVKKACQSRRFGLRLAAAKKVAAGGDYAVSAIRAYAAANGINSIPSSLVDALADSNHSGKAVSQLLTDWASNANFYWRSLAMRGIALRAANARNDKQASKALADFLQDYREDPAWLMRTHARLGLRLLGLDMIEDQSNPERDARARVRLASLLLKAGITPQLQPLFDALADQRTFLGTPWGPRLGQESMKVLKRWLGEDMPVLVAGDQQASILGLQKAAAKKSGQTIKLPVTQTDRAENIIGGVEILSCKNGDQFVQWTNDGTLFFGIDASLRIDLPKKAWAELSNQRTALALESDAGVVVCDSLRVQLDTPKTHIRVAPTSLPQPAADWLKQLAQRLEEVDKIEIAENLRRGLGQFEGQ